MDKQTENNADNVGSQVVTWLFIIIFLLCAYMQVRMYLNYRVLDDGLVDFEKQIKINSDVIKKLDALTIKLEEINAKSDANTQKIKRAVENGYWTEDQQ